MKKPKRNNKRYISIEKIKEYELTECLTFEFAIRAAKPLIDEIIAVEKEFNSKLFDTTLFDKLKNLKNKLREEYYLESWYFTNNTTDYTIFDEEYYDKRLLRGFPGGASKYGYSALDIGESYYLESNSRDFNTPTTNKLTKRLNRPAMIIPKHLNKNITVEINPNIPIEETISFLKSALEEIKNKKSSYAIVEFRKIFDLRDRIEIEYFYKNKKEFKKQIADEFFVYDYISVRLKEIEVYNSSEKNKYLKDIEKIKNNPMLDGSDKKIQIEERKKEYEENIINTTIEDIFNENELIKSIDKSSGTIKRYYYNMKKVIDDLEYRKLITDAQIL